MLLSKTVIQKWNSKNKKRYIELGYIFTKIKDEFEVKVHDLPKYSRAKVLIKCDYCGKEILKEWINYNSEIDKGIIIKDACRDCQHIKAQDVMITKYGTVQPMHVEAFKNKQINTNIKKYGFKNASSSEIVREKVAATNIQRYGGIAPTASDEVKQKVAETCIKKYGCDHHWKNNVIKEKRHQTWLNKYGVDVCSQSEIVKKKMSETCKLKYGVSWFTQSEKLIKASNTDITKEKEFKTKIKNM